MMKLPDKLPSLEVADDATVKLDRLANTWLFSVTQEDSTRNWIWQRDEWKEINTCQLCDRFVLPAERRSTLWYRSQNIEVHSECLGQAFTEALDRKSGQKSA